MNPIMAESASPIFQPCTIRFNPDNASHTMATLLTYLQSMTVREIEIFSFILETKLVMQRGARSIP